MEAAVNMHPGSTSSKNTDGNDLIITAKRRGRPEEVEQAGPVYHAAFAPFRSVKQAGAKGVYKTQS